jgi:hypothetical protein
MQNFKVLATTILGTITLGLGAGIPAANGASLIPQQEGEIKLTNVACLDPSGCIDTEELGLGFTVKSLAYDFDNQGASFGLSRLFVDKLSTPNTYGNGNQAITFGIKDAGTNTPKETFWLRPVAYYYNGQDPIINANALPTEDKMSAAENGELEVGRYLFNFTQKISELKIDFFDVESLTTGILEVNGEDIQDILLKKGNDGNTQTLTLLDVESFVIQLGQPNTRFPNPKGDGVRLSGLTATKAVPEPGMVVSLGALAVVGMFGLKRRKATSRVA